MNDKKIPDKYLYFPILILGVYFLFRLIDQSKMTYIFPLDKYNDWSSYMAQLFFLKECGFHNLCPYWYNGFINFQINQPGWYFFIYPLYLIINNVQITAFLSLLITYLLSFIAIYYNRIKLGLSKTKALALFLFLFANAIAIGNYIKVGKIHELFGWFNLIIIFIFLINYKDKKINKNFFFIIPFYFFAILSHQNSAIISSLALTGLFFIKSFNEKIKIAIAALLTFIATSFWWIDYLKNFFSTTSRTIIVADTLRTINKATLNDNLASFIIPALFLIISYFYFKSVKHKKTEFLFLLPQIIISILLLTRLILLVPIINQVFPDAYNQFLLFFMMLMFFRIDFDLIKKYKSLIFFGLIFISIISVTLNIVFTPRFIEHTDLEKETISVFDSVDEKFVLVATPSRKTSYPNAYYSYAAIYHNLSAAGGWYPSATNPEYLKKIDSLDNILKSKNCSQFIENLDELNVKEIITYDEYCSFLSSCDLNKKVNKSRVCLYSL